MTTHVVVGLNFGDEGKGTLTNYFANESSKHRKPMIVRYSGGHQAGHTIETRDGKRHIFQSFGAGTLNNAPTFWSKYCVMFPIGFVRELRDLQKMQIEPIISFDPEVAVTTIYDVLWNQACELARDARHGSVGVGIGTTYERQTTVNKLFFKDLYYPTVLRYKLENICNYYFEKAKKELHIAKYFYENDFTAAEENFLNCVDVIVKNPHVKVQTEDSIFCDSGRDYIFEGAQGILLDQTHGFFPNVTRCNVTCQNAIEMIDRNYVLKDNDVHIDYITRIYMTRHGAGIFPTESYTSHLIPGLSDKTNFTNAWQQDFRYGCLDFELIKYSLECDHLYHSFHLHKSMNISCMDHLMDINRILIKNIHGEFQVVDMSGLKKEFANIGFYANFRTSYNPYSEFKYLM